jgi:hypothetical protein
MKRLVDCSGNIGTFKVSQKNYNPRARNGYDALLPPLFVHIFVTRFERFFNQITNFDGYCCKRHAA